MSDACTILDDILGRRDGESSHNAARRVVAERDRLSLLAASDPASHDLVNTNDSLRRDRDHWKSECEKARQREVEAAMLHDAEVAAISLPEPDATNPDHLRFAAAVVFKLSEAWAIKPEEPIHHPWTAEDIKSEADRLDAARSAERERERDIKAVATALADSHKLVNAQGWIGWAEVAVDALDALRGGGRGE
ncbi:hypothetical protein SEA_MORKIE_58 [Gordonia phage Morkie]|nr:hypothetical protein SEA_MORKIE_58 [Gordonia phage Morkie]